MASVAQEFPGINQFVAAQAESHAAGGAGGGAGEQDDPDRYLLRPLPFDDVSFYCKKIDNSRLVRSADPRSGAAYWQVAAAACLALAIAGGVVAPRLAYTLAGYKLEALRSEAQRLADERRMLEFQEAVLFNPQRLNKMAEDQHLVTPAAGQVTHLDDRGDGKVAVAKR